MKYGSLAYKTRSGHQLPLNSTIVSISRKSFTLLAAAGTVSELQVPRLVISIIAVENAIGHCALDLVEEKLQLPL